MSWNIGWSGKSLLCRRSTKLWIEFMANSPKRVKFKSWLTKAWSKTNSSTMLSKRNMRNVLPILWQSKLSWKMYLNWSINAAMARWTQWYIPELERWSTSWKNSISNKRSIFANRMLPAPIAYLKKWRCSKKGRPKCRKPWAPWKNYPPTVEKSSVCSEIGTNVQ